MSVVSFDAGVGGDVADSGLVEILPESQMPILPMLSLYCVARWEKIFDGAVIGLLGYGSRHYFQPGFRSGVVLQNEYNDAIRNFVTGYMPRVGFPSVHDKDLISVRPHGDGYLVPSLLHDEEACRQVADRVQRGYKLEAFESSHESDALFAKISSMTGIPVDQFAMTADYAIANLFGDKLEARLRAAARSYDDVYCNFIEIVYPEVDATHYKKAFFILGKFDQTGWEKAILKVPNASSGIGMMSIDRGTEWREVAKFLLKYGDRVFLEEFFGGHLPISATFVLFGGRVYMKHVTTQIQSADDSGSHRIHEGNLVAEKLEDLLPSDWLESLRHDAHEQLMSLCARVLTDMRDGGYRGGLSMDLMVKLDEHGQPVIKLAEINARVTGSMPVSGTARLAEKCRGGRETFVMGMNASFADGQYKNWRELEAALDDLHYSSETGENVLICMGATLKDGKCSLHVVADSPDRCRSIMRLVRRRVGAKPISVQGFEADPGLVVVA